MSDRVAEQVIHEVLETFPGQSCFTCSFQAEDVALLDMLRRARPDIPVLFLETGYHFAETYIYRDELARRWNLNLVNVQSAITVAEQEGQMGKLFQIAPDRCCGIRKVEPLFRELANYDIWFTGLRREQSPTRAGLQQVEQAKLNNGQAITKVSPLAAWKWNEVWAYLKVNEIPHLPLYDQGYTSIGCEPCTAKPSGDDLRSGRWGGRKLECGIHLAPAAAGLEETR